MARPRPFDGAPDPFASPAFAPRWLPVVIVASGVLVYLNSFNGAFVFDDLGHIVENAGIRRLWPVGDCLAGTRPMVGLSLAVNYALSGLKVWSYHAFNLAAHLLAGLTLFGVIRRTLARQAFQEVYGRSGSWLALAVALLWLVHPLQTQSVTYIIQRAESMMGLFYLLTLYCVIRGEGSSRKRWWYAGAVVCCGLGMGSKAVMVTAPVVVLLYDRTFLSRSWGEVFRRRGGLYAGLAATWGILAACGVLQGLLRSTEIGTTVGFGVRVVSPGEHALSQPGVILHYLKLSFWPHPLCLDHWWPVAKTNAEIIPPALLVGALLAGTLWAFWRKPSLGFLGAWFFLILAPTSSFIPIKDLAVEHRMYLPLAAVIMLVVLAGYAAHGFCRQRWRRPRAPTQWVSVALVVVIAALEGYGTRERNRDYRSAVVMWGDVMATRPGNPRAHLSLGVALQAEGELDLAVQQYTRALELTSGNYPKARNNLGVVLALQGRLDDAVAQYEAALRLQPDYAEAHNSLGNARLEQGKLDQAIAHFLQALQLKPDYPEAHSNMGLARYRQGEFAEAVPYFTEALHLQPDYAEAHNYLGAARLAQGKTAAAVSHLTAALRLRPDYAMAHSNLGIALWRQGKLSQAVDRFNEALRIEPDNVVSRVSLGLVLADQGKIDPAIAQYRRALAIDPDYVPAHEALRAALRKRGALDP